LDQLFHFELPPEKCQNLLVYVAGVSMTYILVVWWYTGISTIPDYSSLDACIADAKFAKQTESPLGAACIAKPTKKTSR
jgi:hypothetical protein